MKLTPQEIQQLRDSAKFEVYPWNKGGQNVAVVPRGIKLIQEDLGIEICVNSSRNTLENRRLAGIMFEALLEELQK